MIGICISYVFCFTAITLKMHLSFITCNIHVLLLLRALKVMKAKWNVVMCELFNETILRNFGGIESNNFLNLLDNFQTDNDSFLNINLSSYYSTECMSNTLVYELQSESLFIVLCLNCQSLNSKFDRLQILLEELKQHNIIVSALCLQETWMDDDTDLSLFNLENYTCISQGRHCSMHGGLMTYFHKSFILIQNLILVSLTYSKYRQLSNGKNIVLSNVYRPPKENNNNATILQFMDEFQSVINDLNSSKSHIIACGDFNIDLLKLKERPVISDYFDMLIINNLYPNITFPTRLGHTSVTLIDNIFMNFPQYNIKLSGILVSDISDHLPCFSIFKFESGYKSQNNITYKRKITEKSLESLYNSICSYNILQHIDTNISGDPEHNYNIFLDIITSKLKQNLPLRKIKNNKYKDKKHSWITRGIICSIQYRDKLYKSLKNTNFDTPEYSTIKHNLKVYNNILRRLIRNAKATFFNSQFDKYKYDTKRTWDTIKDNLHSPSSKKPPDYYIINEQTVSNETDIAEEFNNYFAQIGQNMASKLNLSISNFKDYLNPVVNLNFSFVPVTESTVLNVISSLKASTSAGFDDISTNILKKIAPVIIQPLTVIINQSLISGIFPSKLKISKVIPILKKGDSRLVSNYRPISILPSFSKVFEKVVYLQHISQITIYSFQVSMVSDLSVLLNMPQLILQIKLFLRWIKVTPL